MYIVPEATRVFSPAPVTTHVMLARSHDGSELLIWTGTMNKNSDAKACWLTRRHSTATHPARAIVDNLSFTPFPPQPDRRSHLPMTSRPGVLISRSVRAGVTSSAGPGCRDGSISAGTPDRLPPTITRPGVLISRSVRARLASSTGLGCRGDWSSAGTPDRVPPTTTRPGVLISRSLRAGVAPSSGPG